MVCEMLLRSRRHLDKMKTFKPCSERYVVETIEPKTVSVRGKAMHAIRPVEQGARHICKLKAKKSNLLNHIIAFWAIYCSNSLI